MFDYSSAVDVSADNVALIIGPSFTVVYANAGARMHA